MPEQRDILEMPTDDRLRARAVVDEAGGMVAGYCDGGFTVALPADPAACRKIDEGLKMLGLIGEHRITWVPLCSDSPPESMRHYGPGTAVAPRGDRPMYWKYRNFYLA
jgi:hypothetical protein